MFGRAARFHSQAQAPSLDGLDLEPDFGLDGGPHPGPLSGYPSAQAAPAAPAASPRIPLTWITSLLALALVPVVWVTLQTLGSTLATMGNAFWSSPEFFFFHLGVVLWAVFFRGLRGPTLTCTYVFAHEWTHAFFILLSGGKILKWPVVSAQGGHIITNKNNLLIALSPYFFPFYSILIAGIYLVASHLLELTPVYNRVFFALLGFTWAFHITYTFWMSMRSQPDLRQYGTFFSLTFVFLLNLLILCSLFVIASPSLDWLAFGQNWWEQALLLSDQITRI